MRKLISVIFVFFLLAGISHAQQVKRVVIMPFELRGFAELKFLREAMVDMLASRIGSQGGFEIIGESKVLTMLAKGELGPVNEEKAVAAGRLLGADYIILGGLTKLGKNVSLDAKIMDVRAERVIARAFTVSQGLEGVLVQVNKLADQLHAGLLKPTPIVARRETRPAPRMAARPLGIAPQARPQPRKSPSGEIKFKPQAPPVRQASMSQSSPGTKIKFYKAGERPYSQPDWRSRTYRAQIMDVALGDVNGDGKVELLVLLLDKLIIYRWDGQGFNVPIYTHKAKHAANLFYSLDVADINGNGREEIFVSVLAQDFLNSFVLEYSRQGKGFKTIWKDVDKFFRVLDLGDKKRILVGQETGKEFPFYGRVHQIVYRNGRYARGNSLSLPRKSNIYNFIQADFDGSGQAKTVNVDEDSILYFVGPGGKSLAQSNNRYAGHDRYIQYDTVDTNIEIEKDPARIIHHGRLLLRDMDNNGRKEIVTVRNNMSIFDRILPMSRTFNDSAIVGVEWNGASFEERWTTKKIEGSVINLAMADVDGDGKEELVAAVMQPSSFFTGLSLSLADRVKSAVYLYKF
ncbi:MAG: FG-GAP-like repeat-containing protein [Thermodesulfobacteriota bacterium]